MNLVNKEEFIENIKNFDDFPIEIKEELLQSVQTIPDNENFTTVLNNTLGFNINSLLKITQILLNEIYKSEKLQTDKEHIDMYDYKSDLFEGQGFIIEIIHGKTMSYSRDSTIIPDNKHKTIKIYKYFPDMPSELLNSKINVDEYDFSNREVLEYNDSFTDFPSRNSKETILKTLKNDTIYQYNEIQIEVDETTQELTFISNKSFHSNLFKDMLINNDKRLNQDNQINKLFNPINLYFAFEKQNEKTVFDIKNVLINNIKRIISNSKIVNGKPKYLGDADLKIEYKGIKDDFHVIHLWYDCSDFIYLYKDENNIFCYELGSTYNNNKNDITIKRALKSIEFSIDYPSTNKNSLDFMLYPEFIYENELSEITKQNSYTFKIVDGEMDINPKFSHNFYFLEFIGRFLQTSNI